MVQRLVIGSTAMRHHLPLSRAPKDLDVFSPPAEVGAELFWHPSFEDWIPPGTDRCASIDELYTLKVSHAYWELRNGSWLKHMADVVTLKNAGAVLIPELHSLLYKVWEGQHGVKKLNLRQEAADFFSDAVTRAFDHDSLHRSVAYGSAPAYEAVLRDGEEVDMDMSKVWALPVVGQVRLFREEIYVTALERLVIPSGYKYSPRRAYAWALRRTITSLTKGRSARFIVENYGVFRVPDMDYVSLHLSRKNELVALGG